jgi:hypothetical protein
MPIIINEFEIIPESRPQQEGRERTPQQGEQAQPRAPEPEQILQAERVSRERRRRLHAD